MLYPTGARGYVSAVAAGFVDYTAYAEAEQIGNARLHVRVCAQRWGNGAQFGFVWGNVINHGQHVLRHRRGGRGIENDRLAQRMQAADGLKYHRQGNFMLQQEDIAVCQGGKRLFQPLHIACLLYTSRCV